MGWVEQTIGKGKRVNGVIVAKQIADNLRYAVSVMPNVALFEYRVEFNLEPVGAAPKRRARHMFPRLCAVPPCAYERNRLRTQLSITCPRDTDWTRAFRCLATI